MMNNADQWRTFLKCRIDLKSTTMFDATYFDNAPTLKLYKLHLITLLSLGDEL
jgi:hypothetical protein